MLSACDSRQKRLGPVQETLKEICEIREFAPTAQASTRSASSAVLFTLSCMKNRKFSISRFSNNLKGSNLIEYSKIVALSNFGPNMPICCQP
ncbi:hypothetical protein AVEN_266879-1 [Araneus ventricosus]|uniref:Uncharacterized protein n=1 Tax=Araneus ventricosus TaxID=182803 RepID=A0A4Y2F9T1_ARAVE|nr:hypothetical protein AVEN_266879-1 [Araneus ventricosus]